MTPIGFYHSYGTLPRCPLMVALSSPTRPLRQWRTEQFHQYYNQGGPSPMDPQQCDQVAAMTASLRRVG